ncbi:hypothetical protein LTR08_003044 [Meristemomyces frigidus]|nr:hypothetical protein LTR08_003044 [Meristemomyces frigidus]
MSKPKRAPVKAKQGTSSEPDRGPGPGFQGWMKQNVEDLRPLDRRTPEEEDTEKSVIVTGEATGPKGKAALDLPKKRERKKPDRVVAAPDPTSPIKTTTTAPAAVDQDIVLGAQTNQQPAAAETSSITPTETKDQNLAPANDDENEIEKPKNKPKPTKPKTVNITKPAKGVKAPPPTPTLATPTVRAVLPTDGPLAREYHEMVDALRNEIDTASVDDELLALEENGDEDTEGAFKFLLDALDGVKQKLTEIRDKAEAAVVEPDVGVPAEIGKPKDSVETEQSEQGSDVEDPERVAKARADMLRINRERSEKRHMTSSGSQKLATWEHDDADKKAAEFSGVAGQQRLREETHMATSGTSQMWEVDDADKEVADFTGVAGQQQLGERDHMARSGTSQAWEIDEADREAAEFTGVAGQQLLRERDHMVRSGTLQTWEADETDREAADFPGVAGQQTLREQQLPETEQEAEVGEENDVAQAPVGNALDGNTIVEQDLEAPVSDAVSALLASLTAYAHTLPPMGTHASVLPQPETAQAAPQDLSSSALGYSPSAAAHFGSAYNSGAVVHGQTTTAHLGYLEQVLKRKSLDDAGVDEVPPRKRSKEE